MFFPIFVKYLKKKKNKIIFPKYKWSLPVLFTKFFISNALGMLSTN